MENLKKTIFVTIIIIVELIMGFVLLCGGKRYEVAQYPHGAVNWSDAGNSIDVNLNWYVFKDTLQDDPVLGTTEEEKDGKIQTVSVIPEIYEFTMGSSLFDQLGVEAPCYVHVNIVRAFDPEDQSGRIEIHIDSICELRGMTQSCDRVITVERGHALGMIGKYVHEAFLDKYYCEKDAPVINKIKAYQPSVLSVIICCLLIGLETVFVIKTIRMKNGSIFFKYVLPLISLLLYGSLGVISFIASFKNQVLSVNRGDISVFSNPQLPFVMGIIYYLLLFIVLKKRESEI